MQIGVESQRAVENKRIFVIDDDDVVQTALQFMLADENETHVFANLGAALAKAVAWPPNLVLLGTGIAVCDGGAGLAHLKAALSGVKVLLVGDAMTNEQAQALGAVGAIPVPLKLEAVRRKVDAQLGRRTGLAIPLVVE
jgi:CheY-like chemotaxis protein